MVGEKKITRKNHLKLDLSLNFPLIKLPGLWEKSEFGSDPSNFGRFSEIYYLDGSVELIDIDLTTKATPGRTLFLKAIISSYTISLYTIPSYTKLTSYTITSYIKFIIYQRLYHIRTMYNVQSYMLTCAKCFFSN